MHLLGCLCRTGTFTAESPCFCSSVGVLSNFSGDLNVEAFFQRNTQPKLDNAAKPNSGERWIKSPERGLMQVFAWERWVVAFPSFSLLAFPCNQSHKNTWSTCNLRCDYYILNRVKLWWSRGCAFITPSFPTSDVWSWRLIFKALREMRASGLQTPHTFPIQMSGLLQ